MIGIETTTHSNGVTIEIIRDQWLCSCCTMLHANGECCEDQDEHVAALEGYQSPEVEAGWHLASDSAVEEDEEDCDYNEFSWSECDGCGSRLGGSRHRHALIRRTVGGAQ